MKLLGTTFAYRNFRNRKKVRSALAVLTDEAIVLVQRVAHDARVLYEDWRALIADLEAEYDRWVARQAQPARNEDRRPSGRL